MRQYKLAAEITDSGQMLNAMSSYAAPDKLEPGNGEPKFDAVVHFAAVPRIMIKPGNETFLVNIVGTYNRIKPYEYTEFFLDYFQQ
ncbi:hypothetical protein GCM10007390_16490 [Persicitalea jodogahamensis]|uniref:Uncharacterized protein n=1 Tax=Persicitalea jodogahamensis TaxID=402147 RepID=A0A8J3D937_9BACT|nr:hypothetical protein GCM10007390_16490 [Persicitalea jodogahamensis]